MKVIGFTGSRRGMTPAQQKALWEYLSDLSPMIFEFHHGDCVGSDAEAHRIARQQGGRIFLHPPTENQYRAWCDWDLYHIPLPYLQRNHAIVDAADVLIAMPHTVGEQQRSGTWATVRYARKRKIPIRIFYPNWVPEDDEWNS